MYQLLWTLVTLLSLLHTTIAHTTLTGTISNTPKSTYNNIQILLTNPNNTNTAVIQNNNKFTINDIYDGVYLLNIMSIDYIFPNYNIEVNNNDITIKLLQQGEWNNIVTQPFVITPLITHTYYLEREPFNYMSYLKNPMVIMMILTGLMVFVMPRMLNSMDPEELAQIKAAQKNYSIQGIMENLTNKVEANAQQQQGRQRRVQ